MNVYLAGRGGPAFYWVAGDWKGGKKFIPEF